MKDKPRTEDQLLPYDIIEAATRGDITAINSVLAHFEGYIAALATRTLYDEHGCPCQYLDPELKRRLETKLIVRVLKFKLVSSIGGRCVPLSTPAAFLVFTRT